MIWTARRCGGRQRQSREVETAFEIPDRSENGAELRRSRAALVVPPFHFLHDHQLFRTQCPSIQAGEDPWAEVEARRPCERDVPTHLEVQRLVVDERGAADGLQS